jgi:iron complex outermembrane receptor protein
MLPVVVNNLFDEQPPYYSSNSQSRFANMRLTSQYDIIGRRGFVHLQKSW